MKLYILIVCLFLFAGILGSQMPEGVRASDTPSLSAPKEPHPGHPEWRIKQPILKRHAILDLKDHHLYPVEYRIVTAADIPHIEEYWNHQGVFDWPCLIDPKIEDRRAKGMSAPWKSVGVQIACDISNEEPVWGMEVKRDGKKRIEGLALWRDDTEKGRTELKYAETRLNCGYRGVGTLGLALMIEHALLRGYQPYVDAYRFTVPDDRPSAITFFEHQGLIETFTLDDTDRDTVRMVFPDLETAKKFLQKVQGYMEASPLAR